MSDLLECMFCHKQTPDVRPTLDPYAREINEEDIEVDICDDCYQDRCDDI